MAADGINKNAIVRYLNDVGIDTPVTYMNAHGIRKRPLRDLDKKFWTQSTVGDMLKNEIYLGKTIWNKSRRAEVGSRKQIKLPRSEWIIVEGTHEPIISQELFEQANARAFTGKKKTQSKEKKPNLLRCGSCGRGMSLNGSYKSYRCAQAATTGLEGCQCVKRNRYILEEEVLTTAKSWAAVELALLYKNKSKWKHEAREWKGTEVHRDKADKLVEKKLRLYDQYA